MQFLWYFKEIKVSFEFTYIDGRLHERHIGTDKGSFFTDWASFNTKNNSIDEAIELLEEMYGECDYRENF